MASEETTQAGDDAERDAANPANEHTTEGQDHSDQQPDSKMREMLDYVIEKFHEVAPVVGEKLQEGAGIVARNVRDMAPVVGERMREGAGAAARKMHEVAPVVGEKVHEGVTRAGVAIEELRERVADRGGQRGADSHDTARNDQTGRADASGGSDAGNEEPGSAPQG